MALNLDPRQRAMLQDMGITVWLPNPGADSAAAAVTVSAAPAAVAEPPAPPPASRPAAPPRPTPPRPERPTAVEPTPADRAATGWRLQPARPVYAPSDNALVTADGGWLILLERPQPHLPAHPAAAPSPADSVLEGDAARLLDNMLRALRLHQHPRVWSAALERDTQPASDSRPLADELAAMVETLRPARILVLGLAAARAVLGRSDALGRLRAEPHQVAGLPTVVTYDPNYLLRAAHAKPAAWADLCMAKTLNTR